MKTARGLTIRRMVELGRVSRPSFYRFDPERKTGSDRDMELRDAIQRIALEWPCYGRPRVTQELRRQGWRVNPKRGAWSLPELLAPTMQHVGVDFHRPRYFRDGNSLL